MPNEKEPSAEKAKGWWWGGLLALVILALAVAQIWPVARYFFAGIPYGLKVVPGYQAVPLMPGDHLQFHYWLWVLTDNLFGPSAFFTNPYEFNTFLTPHGVPNYANFPFSLLYIVFLPLGPAGAYNALVFLSYVLGGLCAYALARQVLDDRLAALPAALVFAFLPLRQSQVLSGHLYGFVAFLFPLTLWFFEKGLKRGSWRWGAGGGLCLVAMSFMEGHLIYYSALFLGLYVPLRLLLLAAPQEDPESEVKTVPAEPCFVILAGLGLGLFAHLVAVRTQGAAFWSGDLVLALVLYLVFSLVFWVLGAWLISSVSKLGVLGSQRLLARGLLPLALSPLYAVQFAVDAPFLGKAILLSLVLWSVWLIMHGFWPARRLPRLPRGVWAPVWPLAGGLVLGAARMMQVKAHTLDISIAGKGRSLADVKLFTPQVADLFQPHNVHTERLIYSGIVLASLLLAGLVLLTLSRAGRFVPGGLGLPLGGFGAFGAFALPGAHGERGPFVRAALPVSALFQLPPGAGTPSRSGGAFPFPVGRLGA